MAPHVEQGRSATDRRLPQRIVLCGSDTATGSMVVGVIASGVVWPDGHIALRRTEGDHNANSLTLWSSVADLIEAYGQGGRCKIVFVDSECTAEGRNPLDVEAASDRDGVELIDCLGDVRCLAVWGSGSGRLPNVLGGGLREDDVAHLEAELVRAAASEEFLVHYQPIVRVSDGCCIAVEALVRWRHPTRGLLQPVDFIPTAERTGAIIDIGAVVIRRACFEAAAWSGSSGPLAVHVNVSAAQLVGPDIVGTVSTCLAESGIEPCRLVLEITESMLLDSPSVRGTLFALARLGVAIAIDDFGTGYSSLSALRSLPLDIVKIDRSFLEGGATRLTDDAVVEAIVQIADKLGLSVVAEGVERLEQQQFLRHVGAYAAQGFLYQRPAAAHEFDDWLQHQATLHQPSDETATYWCRARDHVTQPPRIHV